VSSPAAGVSAPPGQWRALTAFSPLAAGNCNCVGRPRKRRTLQALTAPALPAASGFYDECMKGEMRYSLGFFKPGPTLPFGQPGSFGAPGAGGWICRICICHQSYGHDTDGGSTRRRAENGDAFDQDLKSASGKNATSEGRAFMSASSLIPDSQPGRRKGRKWLGRMRHRSAR
jgi:hypothetical protein